MEMVKQFASGLGWFAIGVMGLAVFALLAASVAVLLCHCCASKSTFASAVCDEDHSAEERRPLMPYASGHQPNTAAAAAAAADPAV